MLLHSLFACLLFSFALIWILHVSSITFPSVVKLMGTCLFSSVVEHLFCNQNVEGSNPSRGSTKNNNQQLKSHIIMKKKRWTAQEDELLVKSISVFPHKKSMVFMTVAQEIGRTKDAVQYHWYSTLSKNTNLLYRYGLAEMPKKLSFIDRVKAFFKGLCC